MMQRAVKRRGARMCARFGHLHPSTDRNRDITRGFEAYRGDRTFYCYVCWRCNDFVDIATRSSTHTTLRGPVSQTPIEGEGE